MSRSTIPHTDSIRELARFWDEHDLTDFEDDLEEVVELVFEREEGAVLQIRLRPDEAEAVNDIARSRGVGPTTLVRQWLVEKIHQH
ncbi:MAG: hypothetical protein HY321_09780 [Armatimonadetes bacterium]|nr:hypothetical protein [Armatimonadota bacterium]